ncbi:hypothetical protein A1O7_03999 [Cladophialophora yegresii CBS 114405]|uniref:WKF domain-containing protein n=1 Tax=Cladophialophora yegresii CBS 114405 TaxID=1182544 RepID=W9VVQ0_9EURO|nr:uncharacterized protein A1O7_03999 [Cladophialophora yegresii CBS 114405]EXJ59852.1 hypothetical protein A1O7_03999 [Cladophialophora yegresii CBS 114405]
MAVEMGQAIIPAWKRLGLKLKFAQEVSETPSKNANITAETQARVNPSEDQEPNTSERPRKKRKTDSKPKEIRAHSSPASDHSQKPTAGDKVASGVNPKKQVSFSADTKGASATTNDGLVPFESTNGEAQASAAGKKPPRRKAAKKSQQLPVQKANTALDYLTQYDIARPSWKFNKNRETWILKHIFSESDIPRDYDFALSRYIHGLKGVGARERLKSQCMESVAKGNGGQKDVNDAGNSFASGRDEQYAQRFKRELSESTSSDSANENSTDQDLEYRSWIRAQPRSKLLLLAIAVDGVSLNLNGSGPKSEPEQAGDADNGPPPKVKKRKNRTAVVEYDSSSSSSSSDSSEPESESESQSEQRGVQVTNDQTSEDETSSSGSDSESSSDDDSRS